MKTRITVETSTPKTIKGVLLLKAQQNQNLQYFMKNLGVPAEEFNEVLEDYFVDELLSFEQVQEFVERLGSNFRLSGWDTF